MRVRIVQNLRFGLPRPATRRRRRKRWRSHRWSWLREHSRARLIVALDKQVEAGTQAKLPYGNLPRLLLAWVCTEAVRTQRRSYITPVE